MNAYTLRDATLRDYEFLYNLHVATMKQYVEQTWGWDEARAATRFQERFHRSHYQIVEVGGRDVGAINRQKREDTIYISNIEITPEYQGRGVGTAVTNEIIAEARRVGLSVTLRVLKVNPARHLYERLGFIVTKEDETHYYMATK